MRWNWDGAYQACLTVPGTELDSEELAADVTAVALGNANDHCL